MRLGLLGLQWAAGPPASRPSDAFRPHTTLPAAGRDPMLCYQCLEKGWAPCTWRWLPAAEGHRAAPGARVKFTAHLAGKPFSITVIFAFCLICPFFSRKQLMPLTFETQT